MHLGSFQDEHLATGLMFVVFFTLQASTDGGTPKSELDLSVDRVRSSSTREGSTQHGGGTYTLCVREASDPNWCCIHPRQPICLPCWVVGPSPRNRCGEQGDKRVAVDLARPPAYFRLRVRAALRTGTGVCFRRVRRGLLRCIPTTGYATRRRLFRPVPDSSGIHCLSGVKLPGLRILASTPTKTDADTTIEFVWKPRRPIGQIYRQLCNRQNFMTKGLLVPPHVTQRGGTAIVVPAATKPASVSDVVCLAVDSRLAVISPSTADRGRLKVQRSAAEENFLLTRGSVSTKKRRHRSTESGRAWKIPDERKKAPVLYGISLFPPAIPRWPLSGTAASFVNKRAQTSDRVACVTGTSRSLVLLYASASRDQCSFHVPCSKEAKAASDGMTFTSFCSPECKPRPSPCGFRVYPPCVHCCRDDNCGLTYDFHDFLRDDFVHISYVASTLEGWFQPDLLDSGSAAFSSAMAAAVKNLARLIRPLSGSYLAVNVERFEPTIYGNYRAVIMLIVTTLKSIRTPDLTKSVIYRKFKIQEQLDDPNSPYDLSRPYTVSDLGGTYCRNESTRLKSGLTVQWPRARTTEGILTVTVPCDGQRGRVNRRQVAFRKCYRTGLWDESVDDQRCPAPRADGRQSGVESTTRGAASSVSDQLQEIFRCLESATRRRVDEDEKFSASELSVIGEFTEQGMGQMGMLGKPVAYDILHMVDHVMESIPAASRGEGMARTRVRLHQAVRNVAGRVHLMGDAFQFNGYSLAQISKSVPAQKIATVVCQAYLEYTGRGNIRLKLSESADKMAGTAFLHVTIPLGGSAGGAAIPGHLAITVYRWPALYGPARLARRTARAPVVGRREDRINSWVVEVGSSGLSVVSQTAFLTIQFRHIAADAYKPRCSMWKDGRTWETKSCSLVATDGETTTTCRCTQLGSYALVMAVPTATSGRPRMALSARAHLLFYVGCGVAACALLAALLGYWIFLVIFWPHTRWNLMAALCTSLALLHLLYAVAMHRYVFQSPTGCRLVAAGLHFLVLESVGWLTADAVHVMVSHRLGHTPAGYTRLAALVGTASSTVLVCLALLNHPDHYGHVFPGACLFHSSTLTSACIWPLALCLTVSGGCYASVLPRLLGDEDQPELSSRVFPSVLVFCLAHLAFLFAVVALTTDHLLWYLVFAVVDIALGVSPGISFYMHQPVEKDSYEFVVKTQIVEVTPPQSMTETESSFLTTSVTSPQSTSI